MMLRSWKLYTAAITVLAAVVAVGCVDTRIPLTPKVPAARAAQPLPGAVAVMLPYDLRPAMEHKGGSPGVEYIIYLVFAIIDAERGNYVSCDSNFRCANASPATFGDKPSISAAIGESVVLCLDKANLFEKATRLQPEGAKPWVLSETPLPMPRLAAGSGDIWTLTDVENEAQSLQLKGMATPLPECSSPWLLRVHILHVYASRFETRMSLTVSTGQNTTSTVTKTKQYAPTANVVLACELYHMGGKHPVLVWDKTVCGTALAKANDAIYYPKLTVSALSVAMDTMVKDLVQDSPRIRAWLVEQGAPGVASAQAQPEAK